MLGSVDREDVRLDQLRCHNASAYGLRGYVDNTLPSLLCITMILRVRRKIWNYYVSQQNHRHHHHHHHAIVLTKLFPDTLLDREFVGRHRAEHVHIAEVLYLQC